MWKDIVPEKDCDRSAQRLESRLDERVLVVQTDPEGVGALAFLGDKRAEGFHVAFCG
jgi:hypothetical protein